MAIIRTSYRNDFYFGASRDLINRARELRKSQTEAETALWAELRNKSFSDFKFRRQHPVKWFIADFYCHELKLIIEIDGSVHDDPQQAEYDGARSNEL